MSDASGDHMMETYSSMGLVMALYVARIVSFCFPHVVDVSICIVLRAFVVCVCILTVSNVLLMSSVNVSVRVSGLFWLKPVAMVFFILCSALLVECLILKPCCVEICGVLFVMYGSSVFSSTSAALDTIPDPRVPPTHS